MRHGSNKKIVIIIVILMYLFLVGFFPWNMPKLINANKPFIDLSGSIGESIGNAQKAYENAKLTPVPTMEPEVSPIPTTVPDDNEMGQTVKIVVGEEFLSGSGESVFIDGEKIEAAELKKRIESPEYEGKSFILMDYYAETVTYKSVEKILQSSGKQYKKERVNDEDIK